MTTKTPTIRELRRELRDAKKAIHIWRDRAFEAEAEVESIRDFFRRLVKLGDDGQWEPPIDVPPVKKRR